MQETAMSTQKLAIFKDDENPKKRIRRLLEGAGDANTLFGCIKQCCSSCPHLVKST
jgi:hypothetical protein